MIGLMVMLVVTTLTIVAATTVAKLAAPSTSDPVKPSCPHCGYPSFTGDGRCIECGEHVPPGDRVRGAHSKHTSRRELVWMLIAGVAMVGVVGAMVLLSVLSD